MKKLFLLIISGLLLSLNIYAQSSTSATLEGTLKNTKGEPVPNAFIFLTHVPTGTQYATESRDNGAFTIPNIKAGAQYKLEILAPGYINPGIENITFRLGQVLTANLKLLPEGMTTAEIQVTAKRNAVISQSRTGAATNVNDKQIESFPTIARSFQDFAKFTPQFDGKTSSAAGRSSRFNNIQIDGTQYNDLFGLTSSGTPGGQAGTNPISLDAIQEFQVVVAPYDVRLGGFTGGGINAITRSGTNQFSGAIYSYNRNQDFMGKSPDALQKKYPNFTENQTGIRLGGPILQNKLFFFVNAEMTKKVQPIKNLVIDQASTNAVRNQYISYANKVDSIARNKYSYNPGSYTPYDAERPSGKLFLRFDYNLDKNHKITLRHNYVSAYDEITGRNDKVINFSDRIYKMMNNTNSTVLQVNSVFGKEFSNEFIAGYTAVRDKREPKSSSFPSIQIKTPVTGLNIQLGGEEYSQANKLNQDIFELTDNFTWYMDEHTLTFGTHNEFFSFENLFIRDLYGFYAFNSIDDFANGKPSEYRLSYSKLPGVTQPTAKFDVTQLGFYAQDEWKVLPNLKLTYGIRADNPIFPKNPLYNDTLYKYFGLNTSKVPSGKVLISPRIGFNYDVFDDKTTQIRGGLGVFTGKVPYVWISNQYGNTGVDMARLDVKTGLTNGFFQPNPLLQPKPGDPGVSLSPIATTEIDITDKNFKMPQVFRANLAADRQLIYGLVGTVELIFSRAINDVAYQNLNYKQTGNWSVDGRKTYTKVNTNNFTDIILMENTNKNYQYSATFQLQGDLPYGINVNTAYTYNRAFDVNSVVSSQAYSQWRYNPIAYDMNDPEVVTANYEIRHRFFIALSQTFEFEKDWKTTISLFYNIQSGRPFSYIYDGDVNGDGSRDNDLIYIPKDKNDIYLGNIKSGSFVKVDSMYTKFFNYVNNDGYLKKHKGQTMKRNAAVEPWQQQLDLRISQDIPLFTLSNSNHKLQISLDILNLPNLLKNDWGRIKYVNNQTDKLLQYVGKTTDGKQVFSFNKTSNDPYLTDDLLSRWQMQFGIRYSF
jgi:hypothetical protein